MSRLKLIVNSLIVFFILNAGLQAQQALSLEEFIEIALEQNYSLRIVKNQEIISGNNFTRGNAGMLPGIDLRSSFSGNINNSNQNLREGGEFSLRGIHNTTFNNALQGSWMLFDGFRAQIRYAQLEELKNMGELDTRIQIENLIAQLASEYYFYVQQTQQFSNLQYAVDISRERVRIEQEHFLLGSGSKVTLLQAEVTLNADSSRLERQYEVLRASRIRLAELMALPDLSEDLVPADTSITVNPGLMYDNLMEDVIKQNASILAALQNRKISEYDLDLIRSRAYPYLNLSSGYGYTFSTSQSAAWENQHSWGMNYGITVGINLYDGRNLQRQKSNASIELENRDLMLERTQQEITADLLTIYNAYANNLRLLELETQNLAAARENVEIAFDRYRLGALSGFELREVQKNLLEAEERLLSIQYQAKMAEISLLQISGRILESF
ncbi:MAG: TolC family protein [Bacteroidales bacterium]